NTCLIFADGAPPMGTMLVSKLPPTLKLLSPTLGLGACERSICCTVPKMKLESILVGTAPFSVVAGGVDPVPLPRSSPTPFAFTTYRTWWIGSSAGAEGYQPVG